MRTVLLVGLAACGFEGASPVGRNPGTDAAALDATSPADDAIEIDAAAAQPFKLRVEALVDGESHLVIRGSTVKWRHFIYAAPGRWDGNGPPWTIAPILLNGDEWLPTWPDQPTPENRICTMYPCAGVESSSTELPIAVPAVPSTATVNPIATRREQGIVQQPTAQNGWELIVLVSDYGVGGATQLVVEIDVTPD